MIDARYNLDPIVRTSNKHSATGPPSQSELHKNQDLA